MYNTTAIVTAQAFLRKTGEPVCEPREEVIDLVNNDLFIHCRSIMDIKERFESFWNDINPGSKEIVFVHSIVVN